MRVALVHDWLTGFRGGEKVLHELAGLFPDAHLYTLFHVPGSTSERIDSLRVTASPLSRWPGAARHYRKLLPLYPWAIGRFDLSAYDLVISNHHAVAKGVRTGRARHLCYCLTPMRYVWDQADAYLGRGLRRALALPLVAALRRFDRATAAPGRVTRFVGISRCVADRIRRHYGREAAVVHPPVDVDSIRPDGRAPDDFYLLVGGFVPYKAEALAVDAFRRLDRRLVVAGDGPTRAQVQAGAPANVEFLGRVSDARLRELYARCRALVYPQEEDFGIVAVEAQAAGRPVIALGRGGAADTVVPLEACGDATPPAGAGAPTGLWFERQDPESLAAAVRRFEKEEDRFDPAAIRRWAERFGPARFRDELAREVERTLSASRLAPRPSQA
jgi:glycosyltransferase involved in cell wall biosynthesis